MKILLVILLSLLYSEERLLDSYNALDSILNNFVDINGDVNYNGIIENPYNFNEYFKFIEEVSPDSHPEYFNTPNKKMAYWINTYNALIIKLMIDNPEKNILDISMGHAIWFTKFKVGGKNISLYKIEHKILRKMNDPRIHFAINCGSRSCPPLGHRIFLPETLDLQLEEKTKSFINDKNNVYIDSDVQVIYLNKIFKWYKKDYNNVRKFLIKYLEENLSYKDIKDYKIKYYKYDWSSNQIKNL